MSIASTEDHFIELVKDRFQGRLRAVESLPAQWSEKEIERVLRGMPGVFVTFMGGPRIPDYPDPAINAQWIFFIATGNAGGELQRRRGDTREIGAYEVMEILVALLEQHVVPDGVKAAMVTDVSNLFDQADEFQGVSIYRVDVHVPMLLLNTDTTTPPTLDDFIIFDASYDMAPPNGRVDAEDRVTLPQ